MSVTHLTNRKKRQDVTSEQIAKLLQSVSTAANLNDPTKRARVSQRIATPRLEPRPNDTLNVR